MIVEVGSGSAVDTCLGGDRRRARRRYSTRPRLRLAVTATGRIAFPTLGRAPWSGPWSNPTAWTCGEPDAWEHACPVRRGGPGRRTSREADTASRPDPSSWAKRQLDKAGIAYQELDNGFRWCANPAALQRICNHLGPSAVHTFFWRWFHRLPSPFTTEDLQAGYAYELAFRQFEVSDTRVFDQPQAGRAFFEGVIRDHLDIGRPDQVVLIFDRKLTRRTPGRFRTKIVTRGVNPQLSCTYKSCRLKQYFKLGVALRTEL